MPLQRRRAAFIPGQPPGKEEGGGPRTLTHLTQTRVTHRTGRRPALAGLLELVRKKKRRRVSGAGVAAPGRSGMEWMNENRETGIGRPVETGASYVLDICPCRQEDCIFMLVEYSQVGVRGNYFLGFCIDEKRFSTDARSYYHLQLKRCSITIGLPSQRENYNKYLNGERLV